VLIPCHNHPCPCQKYSLAGPRLQYQPYLKTRTTTPAAVTVFPAECASQCSNARAPSNTALKPGKAQTAAAATGSSSMVLLLLLQQLLQ